MDTYHEDDNTQSSPILAACSGQQTRHTEEPFVSAADGERVSAPVTPPSTPPPGAPHTSLRMCTAF